MRLFAASDAARCPFTPSETHPDKVRIAIIVKKRRFMRTSQSSNCISVLYPRVVALSMRKFGGLPLGGRVFGVGQLGDDVASVARMSAATSGCGLSPHIATLMRAPSLHLLKQLPRFTQQRLNSPSLGDRIPGEPAVLARVSVCLWRGGSRGAAVHAAALPAVHRRRAARAAATGLGATAWARQHRAGILDVIAHAWAARSALSGIAPSPGACGLRRMLRRGACVLVRYDHARMLRDVADDGLAAVADRHVLHGDGGLALAPVAVERLDLGGKGAGKPAQRARGAVVLGEIVGLRKVMGTSHRHHMNGNHLRD